MVSACIRAAGIIWCMERKDRAECFYLWPRSGVVRYEGRVYIKYGTIM